MIKLSSLKAVTRKGGGFLKRNWYYLLPFVLIAFLFKGKLLKGVSGAFNSWTNAVTLGDPDQAARTTVLKQQVINTPVSSTLPKNQSYYTQLAETLYNSMKAFQPDDFTLSKDLYAELTKLNVNELKAIYKAFGVRQNYAFMFVDLGESDLIGWFRQELHDSWFWDWNTNMKVIWTKTGLWV